MTDSPKVEQIVVVLSRPTERRMQFSALGFYTVTDDVVTMVNQDGSPFVDPQGKTYTAKLESETPRTIAARMVKRIEATKSRRSNFNRPLIYPPSSIA